MPFCSTLNDLGMELVQREGNHQPQFSQLNSKYIAMYSNLPGLAGLWWFKSRNELINTCANDCDI